MYDQSFNLHSLRRELKKTDFFEYKRLRDEVFREEQINNALSRATQGFKGYSLLSRSVHKNKSVYSCKSFPDRLALRKISRNIIRQFGIRYPNRDKLISNINSLTSEGLSYRVYRLDIKSFYESISPQLVTSILDKSTSLSIPTKRHVREILEHHQTLGFPGLPRGIALSAVIAELVMRDFDIAASTYPGIYFYSRFVDDIIIITSGLEPQKPFLRAIKKLLPNGLCLNQSKLSVETAENCVIPAKQTTSPHPPVLTFEFLGYKFIIREPILSKKNPGMHFRDVQLDIADSKVKRIKTRIIRSLIHYNRDRNFDLLHQRIKYLTSNFSVFEPDRQQRRLAGIYHNYWLIDADRSTALTELDHFLRKALISSDGEIFEQFFSRTSDKQRRQLMQNSFCNGFNQKIYLHFSKNDLTNIQRCWKYA